MEKQDSINILVIIVISTLVRLIFPLSTHIFDSNYYFIGSFTPYFLKADSYYYYQVLSSFGINQFLIYITPYVFTLISLVIFYKICLRLGSTGNMALLYTLFLSLFPCFYNDTLLGYVDTPHLILFCIIFMIYLYLNLVGYYKTRVWWLYALMFVFTAILINFVWTGRPLIYLMFFISVIFHISNKIWNYVALAIVAIIGYVVYFQYRFTSLLHLKSLGVSEYMQPGYVYYFVFFLCVMFGYIFFYNNKFVKYDLGRFFFAGYWFNFVISLFIGRFSSFAIIFGILLMVVICNQIGIKQKIRAAFVIVLLIVSVSGIVSDFRFKPLINRPYNEILTQMDEDLPVLCFWDNGIIIDALTNKTVVMKSTPEQQSLYYFVNGLTTEPLNAHNYFDKIIDTDYYLVLQSNDINKVYYLSYMLESNISKYNIIYNSIRGIQIPGYILENKANYSNNYYWVYKRKK